MDRLSSIERAKRLRRDASVALRRRVQGTLFDDVVEVAAGVGIREPGGFLAEVMAGFDPRAQSTRVAAILANVRARGLGAMPDESEWIELADLIEASPLVRGEPVSIDLSIRAAEKILPYIYATRKDNEDTEDNQSVDVISPLTAEEIEEFQAIWDNEY